MITEFERNDRIAAAYLVAFLRKDENAIRVLLRDVHQEGRSIWTFIAALGAAAGDLIEELGADRGEYLLMQRLLTAAIAETDTSTRSDGSC